MNIDDLSSDFLLDLVLERYPLKCDVDKYLKGVEHPDIHNKDELWDFF
jgi:hypothetical protein